MKDLRMSQIAVAYMGDEQDAFVVGLAKDGTVWFYANVLACWQPFHMGTTPKGASDHDNR